MKDTIKQALLKIDQLQHQVDSLKTLSANKIEVLQSQLDQSNNTVSNLGTLSTAWGTTYAVSAVIVGLLTIALAIATFAIPSWLKKKSKKAISKLNTEFDAKILSLQTAYDRDIKEIKEKFDQKYLELSEANSLQIQELQSTFSEATSKLKSDNSKENMRIQSNMWVIRAQTGESDKKFDMATAMYFVAAADQESINADISVIKYNLECVARCIKNLGFNDIEKINNGLQKFSIKGKIEDYINFFENSPNIEHFTTEISQIKEHLESVSNK